jgi:MFS family permease
MSTAASPDVRRAAGGQGAVLLAAACMPILGSTSIAPLQPAMAAAFPDQPGAEVLVGLILTVPALVIGLTALVAGRLIDRVGRKRVLVIALALYAVVGTAPLWLPTLPAILVSRVFVGLAEAAIFAAAMATIADLFDGHRRARYFGLLNLVTGLAAVVFIALSGALGNENWRMPFWLYAIAAPLAIVALLTLAPDQPRTDRVTLPPVPWRRLLAPILFTLVGGAVFYVPVAMLSFRLAELGVTQTAVIGAVSAGAALALALASLGFPALLRRMPRILLACAFAVLGIGLLVIGLAPSIPLVAVGAVIANAGGGILLSTLQTWIVQGLPYAQRGRASGASTAGLFVGQFLAPLAVFGIAAATGLGPAIAIAGVVGLVAAGVGVVVGRIRLDETADPEGRPARIRAADAAQG